MNKYQVMIEGVFVGTPISMRVRHGLHTTFFIEANNAQNAVYRVAVELGRRLQANGIEAIDSGFFQTYFWVHDIWEITGDKSSISSGGDSGFSFFSIGCVESLYLSFRRIYLSKRKPWLVVDVAT